MTLFRTLLALMFAVLLIYTGIAFANEGPNLIAAFSGNLRDLGWSGQFNLDFMTYLILSAIWVAWRHRFSAAGIMLALVASVAGILFLSIYLLVALARAGGDPVKLLLGDRYPAT